MTTMNHSHRWGGWFHANGERIDWYVNGTYRFCTIGPCDAGQYRNGRRFRFVPPRDKEKSREEGKKL